MLILRLQEQQVYAVLDVGAGYVTDCSSMYFLAYARVLAQASRLCSSISTWQLTLSRSGLCSPVFVRSPGCPSRNRFGCALPLAPDNARFERINDRGGVRVRPLLPRARALPDVEADRRAAAGPPREPATGCAPARRMRVCCVDAAWPTRHLMCRAAQTHAHGGLWRRIRDSRSRT